MSVPVVITADVFQAALDEAEREGMDGQIAGLGAPLGAAIAERVADVWDRVRYALQVAYRYGAERAAESTDLAIAAAEDSLNQAGKRAADVQAHLIARLRRYAEAILRRSLAQVQPAIDVGGRHLELADVTIAQRIAIGGSLKASITDLISFTANGEFQVQARYAGSSR